MFILDIFIKKTEVNSATLFKCSDISKCRSRKAKKYNTNGIHVPEKYVSVSSL